MKAFITSSLCVLLLNLTSYAQNSLLFKIKLPFADSVVVTYIGNVVNGKAEGTGTAYDFNDRTIVYYTGQWKNNHPNGNGVMTKKDNSNYNGQWRDGKLNGKGVYAYGNLDKYDGYFVDNLRSGKGIYNWNDGNSYNGDWLNGERTGKGFFTWKNGLTYDGDWKDSKRDGKGKMTFDNGTYDGDWLNGERTGKGIFNWKTGEKYDGEFVEGKRVGRGIYTDANGEIKDGYWEDSYFIGTKAKGASSQGVLPYKEVKTNRYGFKDGNGKILIQPKYYNATDFGTFDSDFSRVDSNGSTGLVNSKGIEIVAPKYFSIEKFSEGLAVVRKGNNNYGFIDINGKEVIPLTYNYAKSFANGFAVVTQYDKKDKPKRGIIDKEGKVIVPLKYDELYGFSKDGISLFNLGDKKGFVNKQGIEVFSSGKYERLDYPIFNRAAVSRNDKWGFININGKEVISLKYDMAEAFEADATAKVRVGTQYFLIDTLGNLVKGNVGFNITAKVVVAKDRWVVVTQKDLKASEPIYFLTANQYGKYPMPFGAKITWQIIDSQNNVIKEERVPGGESCGFKVPRDGVYTIQAYYDVKGVTGGRSEDRPSAFTMEYSFNTKL